MRSKYLSTEFETVATAFFLVLFYYVSFSFKGFDYTDTGFHLTQQLYAVNFEPVFPRFNKIFLTNFIGGLWMKLSPLEENWLWWAYLGGCLIKATAAGGIAFLITRSTTASHWASVFSTVTAFVIFQPAWVGKILHYYSLPFLLIVLWLCAVQCALNSKKGNLWWVVVGHINSIMVFAKFTLILIFPLPIFVFLLQKTGHNWNKLDRQAILFWTAGSLVCTSIIAIFYCLDGQSINVLQVLSERGNSQLDNMSKIYREFKISFEFGLKVLGAALFFTFISQNKIGRWFAALLALYFIATLCLPLWSHIANSEKFYWIAVTLIKLKISALIFPIIVLFGWAIMKKDIFLPSISEKKVHSIATLLLLVTAVTFLSFLGTNTGIIKIIYVMPIAGAYAIYFLLQLCRKPRTNFWIYVVLAALSINGVYFSKHTVYREASASTLTVSSSLPQLKWVRSSKERITATEGLVVEVGKYIQSGEPLWVLNGGALIHYLCKTKPAFGESWLLRYNADFLNKILQTNESPRWVLILKNVPYFRWPASQLNSEYQNKIDSLKNDIITPMYGLVSENTDYELYKKK